MPQKPLDAMDLLRIKRYRAKAGRLSEEDFDRAMATVEVLLSELDKTVALTDLTRGLLLLSVEKLGGNTMFTAAQAESAMRRLTKLNVAHNLQADRFEISTGKHIEIAQTLPESN